MQTTMRVSTATRDALAQIATSELGGVSLDEALRVVLFHHQTALAIARLSAEPEALADYQTEAGQLAETDTAVMQW